MVHRFHVLELAVLALTLGLSVASPPVLAQNTAMGDNVTDDPLSRPINLDVHSATLYDTLTAAFDQAKLANFTLPEALKEQQVSARFTRLPLRTALEALLTHSGYVLKVDRTVYSLVAREVDMPTALRPDQKAGAKTGAVWSTVYKINGSQVNHNASTIVDKLAGKQVHVGDPTEKRGTGNGDPSPHVPHGGFCPSC